MGVVLYHSTVMPHQAQHAKPVRAVVGGPSKIASSICPTSPTDQRPIGADLGSPYWRKAIDLNDRRRLLYHPKYCERMFPTCLCSRTVPVNLLPFRKFTSIHPKMELSMSGMRMVFTNSHDIPLYSTAWTPHSAGAYGHTLVLASFSSSLLRYYNVYLL